MMHDAFDENRNKCIAKMNFSPALPGPPKKANYTTGKLKLTRSESAVVRSNSYSATYWYINV